MVVIGVILALLASFLFVAMNTVVNFGGLYGFNVEILAADKTLTVDTDEIYQYLNPLTASNRAVTLETAGATAGDRFIIRNNGVYTTTRYLEVKQEATVLDHIYSGAVKEFIFDGANWVSRGIGTGEDDSKRHIVAIGSKASAYKFGVAIGSEAEAYDYGVAVGYDAEGYSSGVALGHSAKGTTQGIGIGQYADGRGSGVAVGWDADGYSSGVAIGYRAFGHTQGVAVGRESNAISKGVAVGWGALGDTQGVGIGYEASGRYYGLAVGYRANTNGLRYGIALGYNSKCYRIAETAVNIDVSTLQTNAVTQGRWAGVTNDEVQTEVFLGKVTNARFTVRAKSALAFTGTVVASTEATTGVPNLVKAWKVEGLIKRDADGNTTIVSITHAVIAQDAGAAAWDAVFSADDGNEALILKVTGAAATAIQWAASIDGVETIWP